MIGKVLGNRYRIMREVGSGGMAQVYLAEDANSHGLVAVKVLYPQFGEDLSYVQRFKREAKLASELTDSHIVRVLDYGADRDLYYLVMEYISGRDLRDYLDETGPFSWRDALETIDQLATALEHADEHGIVHRDIKPQNLMLNQVGLLKVLDFGIARVDALPSLTQSGFVGSPYYVSPEQAMGEPVDIRSDIYSSGIVLYELLSGDIPFDAKSPWSVISKHISSEAPPINFQEDDVPAEVQDILGRMIAKKAEDRFQTPAELRERIAVVLFDDESLPADQTAPTDSTLDSQQRLILSSYYRRGLKAIEAEQWGRAIGLFTQVLRLDPNRVDAREKLNKAEQESQLVSDYDIAKQAIANGFWQDAVSRLEQVLKIDPQYRDAAELYGQAKKKSESHQANQTIETLYAKAITLVEAEQWERAIETLQEVQRLSPNYKQTEPLLMQAQAALASREQKRSNRLYYLAAAALAMVVLVVVAISLFPEQAVTPTAVVDAPPAAETADPLRTLYQEAQAALEAGDTEAAIATLREISEQDPNYANVADLLRDLTATPTPEPTIPPVPTADVLADALSQAEASVGINEWDEAIEILTQIQATDAAYQEAAVNSLLCDAYVGRGLAALALIDSQAENEMAQALAALVDFEAGVERCPRRTDLNEQANRAQAYIQALNTPATEYTARIEVLTPIVAASANYANNNAKNMLYTAYVARGQRQDEIVLALSDFDAALALNVDDPTEAQRLRAQLLIEGRSPTATFTPIPQPTATPTEAILPTVTPVDPVDVLPTETTIPQATVELIEATATLTSTPVITATATPTAVPITKAPPQLLTPNDTFFSGRLTEVFLEWQSEPLAEDEYYDLTITYLFGEELRYWGQPTRETRLRIPPEMGAGEAGNDRFDWWVTIRKDGTAPPDSGLDQPVSPQSEVRWFIWTVN